MAHVDFSVPGNPHLTDLKQKEIRERVRAEIGPQASQHTVDRWGINFELLDEMFHGGEAIGVPASVGTIEAFKVLDPHVPETSPLDKLAFWTARGFQSQVMPLQIDRNLTGWTGPSGDPFFENVQKEGVAVPQQAELIRDTQSFLRGQQGPPGPQGAPGPEGDPGAAGEPGMPADNTRANQASTLAVLGVLGVAAFVLGGLF